MDISDPRALPEPRAPLLEPESKERNPGQSSWRIRRRLMFVVIAFCMACIAWILYKGVDNVVAQTTITMGFGTMSAITGSYVFGAVWEDSHK